MPITFWNDAVVLGPCIEGFAPAAEETAALAKRLAPHLTGRLAGAVNVVPTGLTSARLGAPGVPYLAPVVKGQRAHTEVPNTKKALVATPYGVFARVEHPAVAGNPFLNEAAAAFRSLYVANVRARWSHGGGSLTSLGL
jgi:hypothetical protein